MTVNAGAAQVGADAPKYARFTRRLRGVAIDFMLFLVAMVVALQIATALNRDDVARIVGVGFLACYFLYETLLVSIAGGTIGHRLSNLRVVDDRSHGNVSFPKAIARVVIKTVLGWFSFLTMAAARRHQAVHDLLTRSTVQVRDPARAEPTHYSYERSSAVAGLPSRARRIVVTSLYVLGSYFLLGVVVEGLIAAGIFSRACLRSHRCSGGDVLIEIAAAICLFVVWGLSIARGWQGRLWGARRRAESPLEEPRSL
jgi:hypothetical protein